MFLDNYLYSLTTLRSMIFNNYWYNLASLTYINFFTGFGDNENNGLKTTAQYLTEACQSGALTCLVCISSIKRTQKVNIYIKQYLLYHLQYITIFTNDLLSFDALNFYTWKNLHPMVREL